MRFTKLSSNAFRETTPFNFVKKEPCSHFSRVATAQNEKSQKKHSFFIPQYFFILPMVKATFLSLYIVEYHKKILC